MNTTIEALKNLYVARGGELTDAYEDIAGGAQVGNYTVIPDCVVALTKQGSGGGDGNEFLVTADLNIETFEITNLSASFSEIQAAVEANKNVRLIAKNEENAIYFICSLSRFAGNLCVFFGASSIPSKGFVNCFVTVDSQRAGIYMYQNLPNPAADDDGKVLAVVDGAWAKSSLPEIFKPTYDFGFTATEGTDPGTFVVTPDSGVTYAAIMAALAATSNVKANVTLGDQQFIIPFGIINNASGAEFVEAAGLAWTGTKFMGCYLNVAYDDTTTFDIHDT